MFGLEGQKKKKSGEEFVFDLEKELKDPAKQKEIRANIDDKIQKIKEYLRSGDEQEEFDRFGLLLQGYTSLLKILSRLTAPTNPKGKAQ